MSCASSTGRLASIVRIGDVMIFSTVSLPSGLPEDTARRTISVSVTMPTNCLPFFTNNELTRADFIVLAALTTEVVGLTDFGLLVMILDTGDIVSSLLLPRPVSLPTLFYSIKRLGSAFQSQISYLISQ